jgi:hypothetical protein
LYISSNKGEHLGGLLLSENNNNNKNKKQHTNTQKTIMLYAKCETKQPLHSTFQLLGNHTGFTATQTLGSQQPRHKQHWVHNNPDISKKTQLCKQYPMSSAFFPLLFKILQNHVTHTYDAFPQHQSLWKQHISLSIFKKKI